MWELVGELVATVMMFEMIFGFAVATSMGFAANTVVAAWRTQLEAEAGASSKPGAHHLSIGNR